MNVEPSCNTKSLVKEGYFEVSILPGPTFFFCFFWVKFVQSHLIGFAVFEIQNLVRLFLDLKKISVQCSGLL